MYIKITQKEYGYLKREIKNQRRRNKKLTESLRSILELGREDTSNPKYDDYYRSASDALNNIITLP